MTKNYFYKYDLCGTKKEQIDEIEFYNTVENLMLVVDILNIHCRCFIESVMMPTEINGVCKITQKVMFETEDRFDEYYLKNRFPTLEKCAVYYGMNFHVGDKS